VHEAQSRSKNLILHPDDASTVRRCHSSLPDLSPLLGCCVGQILSLSGVVQMDNCAWSNYWHGEAMVRLGHIFLFRTTRPV
jgi:hypothetical protein